MGVTYFNFMRITDKNNMTLQERLQEAKEQAIQENLWLKTIGVKHWASLKSHEKDNLIDRVAEIMYEAGKKESDLETSRYKELLEISNKTNLMAIENTYQSQKQADTYRKALDEIRVILRNEKGWYSILVMVDKAQELTEKALKP